MKPRPKCVHCGEPYGQRRTTTEFIKWKMGETAPTYRGNGIVTRQNMRNTAPHNTSGSYSGVRFGHNDNVIELTIWDGESYCRLSYKPFCTMRCALSYARKAYALAFAVGRTKEDA